MRTNVACVLSIVSTVLAYGHAAKAAEQLPEGTGVYSTCNLEGVKIGPFLKTYVGYTGALPKKMTINFNQLLTAAWKEKFVISNYDKQVVLLGMQVLGHYDVHHATKITLAQYVHRATLQTYKVLGAIDWSIVSDDYFRKNSDVELRLALLQAMASRISGPDLIAYALTELMPGTNGEQNKQFLNCLLRNGGKEFVESIPSLGDKLSSVGPFQLTSFAVFDDGKQRKGASRVSAALPEDLQIPSTLAEFKQDQHLRAAYLFAISNLADMISQLNREQLLQLEKIADQRQNDVFVFLAIAHHNPRESVSAMQRWLDQKAVGAYQTYLNRFGEYAVKTLANRSALYS